MLSAAHHPLALRLCAALASTQAGNSFLAKAPEQGLFVAHSTQA